MRGAWLHVLQFKAGGQEALTVIVVKSLSECIEPVVIISIKIPVVIISIKIISHYNCLSLIFRHPIGLLGRGVFGLLGIIIIIP